MGNYFIDRSAVADSTGKGARLRRALFRPLRGSIDLDTRTLYVLLNEKPISVKEKGAGLAGKTVTVTGFPVERNGVKGLHLQSVKPD